MSMTNYLEDKVLNHIAKKATYTAPTKLYLALFTELIDGEEGTAVEVQADSYSRAAISFATAVDGVLMSDTDTNFPVAEEEWGTITAVGVYDALTNGNMLFYTTLASEQNIVIDNQLIFKTGKLTITLD